MTIRLHLGLASADDEHVDTRHRQSLIEDDIVALTDELIAIRTQMGDHLDTECVGCKRLRDFYEYEE